MNSHAEAAGQSAANIAFWPGPETLPTITADKCSAGFATAINDQSVMTGNTNIGGGPCQQNLNVSVYGQAFLLAPGGTLQYLPLLSGTVQCTGLDLNEANEVVGVCFVNFSGGGSPQAFIYTNGQMTRITSFNAFRYPTASASGINNHSVVVGTGGGSFGSEAFIWDRDHSTRNLNILIPAGSMPLARAVKINDAGQIIAVGLDNQPYLLTPVASADLAIVKSGSPDPATVGGTLTYTITVSNGGPTAATGVTVVDTLPLGVTFMSTTLSAGSCSGTATVACVIGDLASGASATITVVVQPTAAGTLTNTATVTGDQPDPTPANNSATIATTVNRAATTTTLTSSVNPSAFGQAVTFTATVASGVGTPTGTITFMDGATALGTGALNASGQATFNTAALAVGSHSVTAVYSGDAQYNTSTSASVLQMVHKAATTTTLVSSPHPATVGQVVTLSASVSVVAPGAGAPTGIVTFIDGATTLGTSALDATGQAMLSTSSLTVGAHSLSAVYSGDAQFNGSASATVAQTVHKADTTTILVSSANPSVVGQAVTFTATVSAPTAGAGTPTGTATFSDGATVLGSATLNAVGQAMFTTSSLTAGTHSITAAYGGDGTFNGIASAPLAQTINAQTGTIAALISQVAALNLHAGQENSLTAKLRAAQQSMARGNLTAASNQLSAFINEVRALKLSGQLSASSADALIVQAQAIINVL